MPLLYVQQDPKVSVAAPDDLAVAIPTPEQLGSFLVVTDGAGSNGRLYAAVEPGPQWVLLGSGVISRAPLPILQFSGMLTADPGGLSRTGYVADSGIQSEMQTGANSYPISAPCTLDTAVINCPFQNSLTAPCVIEVRVNFVTVATLTYAPLEDGQKTAVLNTPVVVGDVVDITVEVTGSSPDTRIGITAGISAR